jgi:hypothetical protein
VEALERAQQGNSTNEADRDTLYLLGGIALVVFGAGLILSNPAARRLLGQVGLGDLTGAALPDIERYLKLRSM